MAPNKYVKGKFEKLNVKKDASKQEILNNDNSGKHKTEKGQFSTRKI